MLGRLHEEVTPTCMIARLQKRGHAGPELCEAAPFSCIGSAQTLSPFTSLNVEIGGDLRDTETQPLTSLRQKRPL